jgi:hypothetical protein
MVKAAQPMEDLKKFDFTSLVDMLVMQTRVYKSLKQQGASPEQLNISRQLLKAIQDEIKIKHQQIQIKLLKDDDRFVEHR